FAHLPLILKPNGKGKLSKRDGDKEGFPVFPLEYTSPEGEVSAGYRESGYFPEAVNNLLALLGWNPGTDQEMFSLEELIQKFSLERVNKSGARFDPDKARWFNQQYLMQKSDAELAAAFMPLLEKRGVRADSAFVEKVVALVKERVQFVPELWEQAFFFFEAPVDFDAKVVQKRWKGEVPVFMEELARMFNACTTWEATLLKEKASELMQEHGLGFGAVANALRLALTGGAFGPDLFAIVELLGKEEVLGRLSTAFKKLS
ncbi:MAG TPA: glutamate--tRNA ligase, partial [Bacteroidales bacterium]|nr:glutamate--tRNA ligase [Bacteroidales bacterium]